MDKCTDGKMDGRMDWKDRQMDEWIGWIDRCMDGQMDSQMDWIYGQIDGFILYSLIIFLKQTAFKQQYYILMWNNLN